MSMTKPATCGTCRRLTLLPGSKRYGTCAECRDQLLCVDRAGCYRHQERAKRATAQNDAQVRMEDVV